MTPDGTDILNTLLNLYEKQEQITISNRVFKKRNKNTELQKEENNDFRHDYDGTWEGWNGTPVTT